MSNFPQLPQINSQLSQIGQSFAEGQKNLQNINLSKQQIEVGKQKIQSNNLAMEINQIAKQAAEQKQVEQQQKAVRGQELRQLYANTPREEIESGKIVENLLKEGFHEEATEIQGKIQKEKDIETRTVKTMVSNMMQHFASSGNQAAFNSLNSSLPTLFGEDSAMSEFSNKAKDLKLEGDKVITFQTQDLDKDNKFGLNPGKYKMHMEAPSSDMNNWKVTKMTPVNEDGEESKDFTPSNVISVYNRQMETHFNSEKAAEETWKLLKQFNPDTTWTKDRLKKQITGKEAEFKTYETVGHARKAAKTNNTPWFASEEQAAKAFSSGEIKTDDLIIVGNQEGRVED